MEIIDLKNDLSTSPMLKRKATLAEEKNIYLSHDIPCFSSLKTTLYQKLI